MSEGVDFSWDKPTVAQLKAAGKSFVGVYLNDPGSKGITAAQLKAYLDGGIGVYLIWEGSGAETKNGAAGGTAAGASAKSLLAALGLPASTNVFYAVDYDVTTQLATIDAFLNAASAAQGHKASVYGEFDVIEHCVGATAAYGFQTYAWSHGKVSSKTAVYQYLNGQSLAGNTVDLNRNLKTDFGAVNGKTLGASTAASNSGSNITSRPTADIQKLVGATPDGIYGPDTTAKVKAWQKAHGLTADGIWGPQSDAKGFPAAAAPAPAAPKPGTVIAKGVPAPAFPLPAGSYFGPKSGPAQSVSGYYSHSADLKRWQQRMAARGWAIKVDGLYGPQTQSVAKQFQAEKHLTVDGLIGPQTWAAAWTADITA
jgi:peptidoglycan hydrolase-like protein with peptidoglycan-binding domain